MELIALGLLALMLGILVGLLPALPVFLAPMMILPFAQHISIEAMLVTWMLAMLGAQYFGSVAVITTRIPGEDNTLVYLRDLDGMTASDKIDLIRQTAQGSLLAGLISAVLLWALMHLASTTSAGIFSRSWVQVLIYGLVILSFCASSGRHWWAAIFLCGLGVMLSVKNNYAIPDWWIGLQNLFQNTTMFMMVLGVIIIPHSFERYDLQNRLNSFALSIEAKFPWILAMRSSMVGFVAGMIPGPSSYLGTYAAYTTTRGSVKDRIIAAETANNSAAIACALPFLLTAIPVNQNTMLLLSAFDLKQIDITQAIWHTGSTGLSLLHQLVLAIAMSSVIYYFLATNFMALYVKIIEFFHRRVNIGLLILMVMMCAADIYISGINTLVYVIWTFLFATLGVVLNRFNISAIPLLFGIIIGDRLVWSLIQTIQIYF